MLTGLFWTQCLMFVAYLYVIWAAGGEWLDRYVDLTGGIEPSSNVPSGLGIVGICLGATFITYLLIRWLAGRKPGWGGMVSGVNMMIVGGHMLDASATFVGVDFFGYLEKHKLPSILIDRIGSAVVMFPLKLLFLIPALYVIDVWMGEEVKKNPHLVALVKLTILILGAAPGTRDLIRLMGGV